MIPGDPGDFFYIIDTGQFEVYQSDSKTGKESLVFTYDNQGSFGEVALMYGAPRGATVRATSAGRLWAVDRLTFRHVVVLGSAKRRRLYERFIERVPLLGKYSPYLSPLLRCCCKNHGLVSCSEPHPARTFADSRLFGQHDIQGACSLVGARHTSVKHSDPVV